VAQRLRSNFSPIQEVGCTARFRVSDTRCGTYVIYAAYLEGRRSIRLSYGRADYTDFKSFIAIRGISLKALTIYHEGGRSAQTELRANRATIVSSSSYSDLFNSSNADSRSIRSNWGFFGRNFKAQTRLSR
jgi:hypothetical protein